MIREAIKNLFVFFGGRLARVHDVLNLTEIIVTDSILMMVEYICG